MAQATTGSEATRTVAGRSRAPRKGRTASVLDGQVIHHPSRWTRIKNDAPFLLMCLPTLVFLSIFHYFPMLGNIMAFEDYSPFSAPGFQSFIWSDWVGLENFRILFDDPAFWRSVLNTLVLTGLNLLLYFPVPIILAIALNSINSYWVKSITQSIFYLPHFLSWVVVVTLFTRLFSPVGLVTGFLERRGIDAPHIIGNPDIFPFLVTQQSVWKDAGWGVIIFLAALAAVSHDLHEAAAMDGCGWWGRMWHVTLPAIRPTIVMLLILRLGDALNVGFEQFLLQRPAVGPDAAEVMDTYVYYVGIDGGGFSQAAAAGLLKGVIGLVLVLAANKAAHALGEDGIYRGRPS